MVSSAIGSGISLYYLGASGIHSHTRIGKHTLGQGKSSQRTTGIPTQLAVPKCKPVAALKREVIRSCLTATGNHSRRFPQHSLCSNVGNCITLVRSPGGIFPKIPYVSLPFETTFLCGNCRFRLVSANGPLIALHGKVMTYPQRKCCLVSVFYGG